MATATVWFLGNSRLIYVNSHSSLDPEAAIRESRCKMKRDTFLALVFITLVCSSWRKCFSQLIVQSLALDAGSGAAALFDVAAVFV